MSVSGSGQFRFVIVFNVLMHPNSVKCKYVNRIYITSRIRQAIPSNRDVDRKETIGLTVCIIASNNSIGRPTHE